MFCQESYEITTYSLPKKKNFFFFDSLGETLITKWKSIFRVFNKTIVYDTDIWY